MKEKKNLSIKNWALDDRPREKLISKGIDSLSDAELIAILISSGNREESAVELSKRILISSDNSLNLLGRNSVNDLMKFKGIGEAKAITIVAALELGKRRKLSEIIDNGQIKESIDVYEYFYPTLGDLVHEEFWILMLNNNNKIIEKRKIGQGGISETTVDVRIILKYAIEKNTVKLILCHNHPSGNKKPSNADILITNKIKDAANVMEIKVIDHLIICGKEYYSFADEGLINCN